MKNYKNRNSLIVQTFMDTYLSYNFINPEEVEKIRKVFKLLDENNDGMLSKNELISGFRDSKIMINQEELDEFLKKIERNNNGLIEYEEFIRVWPMDTKCNLTFVSISPKVLMLKELASATDGI